MVPAIAQKPAGPPAGSPGFHRIGVHHPAGDIERVNVLLGDDVARQEAAHPPRLQTDFRIGRILAQNRVHMVPRCTTVVVRLKGDQFSEFPLVHPPDRILIQLIGTGLEIDLKAQLCAGGEPAAFLHRKTTGNIHGDRLGEIDMFPGLNCSCGLLGVKVGRCLDNHGVQLLPEQLLVTGQPGEPAAFRHIKLLPGLIHRVLEIVCQGHNVVVPILAKQVGDPPPTTTATDQANVYFRIGLGSSHKARTKQVDGYQ